jgi:NAD(P)-dependent dehydrogenase (short-subunit alcohol dehydrogenase family)
MARTGRRDVMSGPRFEIDDRTALEGRSFAGALVDQVVVITGSSGGLGRALAGAFGRAGYCLVLHYYRNAEAAQSLASAVGPEARVTTFQGDLGRQEDCDRLIAHARTEFGEVGVLVNNSGIALNALVHRFRSEDWENVLRTNLTSALYTTRAVLPGMYERRAGRIINISSAAAQRGFVGAAAYAASKGGLNALTRVVAVEAAPYGVTCNVIAPGLLDGGLGVAISQKIREAYLSFTPLGRMGDPADVGELAVFLASPAGAYITGQIIGVNGGIHM